MLIQLHKWSIFSQADASQENVVHEEALQADEISREQLLDALHLTETEEARKTRHTQSWQKLTQKIKEENDSL